MKLLMKFDCPSMKKSPKSVRIQGMKELIFLLSSAIFYMQIISIRKCC